MITTTQIILVVFVWVVCAALAANYFWRTSEERGWDWEILLGIASLIAAPLMGLWVGVILLGMLFTTIAYFIEGLMRSLSNSILPSKLKEVLGIQSVAEIFAELTQTLGGVTSQGTQRLLFPERLNT